MLQLEELYCFYEAANNHYAAKRIVLNKQGKEAVSGHLLNAASKGVTPDQFHDLILFSLKLKLDRPVKRTYSPNFLTEDSDEIIEAFLSSLQNGTLDLPDVASGQATGTPQKPVQAACPIAAPEALPERLKALEGIKWFNIGDPVGSVVDQWQRNQGLIVMKDVGLVIFTIALSTHLGDLAEAQAEVDRIFNAYYDEEKYRHEKVHPYREYIVPIFRATLGAIRYPQEYLPFVAEIADRYGKGMQIHFQNEPWWISRHDGVNPGFFKKLAGVA